MAAPTAIKLLPLGQSSSQRKIGSSRANCASGTCWVWSLGDFGIGAGKELVAIREESGIVRAGQLRGDTAGLLRQFGMKRGIFTGARPRPAASNSALSHQDAVSGYEIGDLAHRKFGKLLRVFRNGNLGSAALVDVVAA